MLHAYFRILEACYNATFTPAALDKKTSIELKISPYYPPRPIASNLVTLVDAIRTCDTYAKTKVVKGPFSAGYVLAFRYFYHMF